MLVNGLQLIKHMVPKRMWHGWYEWNECKESNFIDAISNGNDFLRSPAITKEVEKMLYAILAVS